MELFEQMRREYEHGVGTIKGVARKFGVHRRMVREALGSAIPQDRKQSVREKPKLSACVAFIDAILESDRQPPRKQKHTARRMAAIAGGDSWSGRGRVDRSRVRSQTQDRAGSD